MTGPADITAALLARHGTKGKRNELRFQCVVHPEKHTHSDADPSAHWNESKGVWHCKGCGASGGWRSLAEGLGIPVDGKKIGGVLPSVTGVTVLHLAEAKRLDPDFLRGLGVTEYQYSGRRAIRVCYYDIAGNLVGVRFRLSLEGGQRFAWRRGDRVSLYGLWRLRKVQETGWVLLVEGESDCWTAWSHAIPAIGIPGKSTWRREWAAYLAGLQVFLWQEPGAENLAHRLAADLPNLLVIEAPDGIKDISAAHIQGKDLPLFLGQVKATAAPASALVRKQEEDRLRELNARAATVIHAGDPLAVVEDAIHGLGYGGDTRPVVITYLALTSRLLAMRLGTIPVHLLLLGGASTGKSYTLQTALRLFPPEAYHAIDAGSPRVLIYDDADLQHRAVLFGEADSLPSREDNPAASAIRNLLQDNHLHYKVTVRDAESGDFSVRVISKPGPSVLVTTAVRRLGQQLDSRLFSLEVPDDPGQVRQSLDAQAEIELSGSVVACDALIAYQSHLQVLAPWEVVVPFAKELASSIGKSTPIPRINRDFARLLSLVKAVAVMRHPQRKRNDGGRLVAQIEDYATVFDLVGQMYEATVTGASDKIRQVVKAVADLRNESVTPVGVTLLAEKMGIGKMAASRRAHAAVKLEWLINDEFRKGYPANFRLGEPLPDQVGLPKPEVLRDRITVTPLTDGSAPPSFLLEPPLPAGASRTPFDEGPGGSWVEDVR